jgi:two-component system alkaline phosphatase synthesis response regulator PhoP
MENKTKKVLIIDDDQTFQKLLPGKIAELGYSVISSFDGEDGYNKIVNEKPDLILLDIKMPKVDGIELLKRINLNKDIPKIPILLTSNLSTVDYISEAVTLGVKGYIVKSSESLENIVKEVDSILKSQSF